MSEQEPKPDTNAEQPAEKPEAQKTPEQLRAERIGEINQQLDRYEGPRSDRALEMCADEIDQQYKHASWGALLSDETRAHLDEKMQTEFASLQERFSEFKDHQAEKIALEYVRKVLDGQPQRSFIDRPMNQECKVAIMIPVYNETASTILRSLSSLSTQERVSSNMFEVDIVVNNRKRDAQEQTDAFLANQELIGLIKYINGNEATIPAGVTPEQVEQIESIRNSQIVVNVIDEPVAILHF